MLSQLAIERSMPMSDYYDDSLERVKSPLDIFSMTVCNFLPRSDWQWPRHLSGRLPLHSQHGMVPQPGHG